MAQDPDTTVRHFRQMLLWPLELIAGGADAIAAAPWQNLTDGGAGALWRTVEDEFPDDPALFQERHYGEFVTFLPYVQRLLYGEGATRGVGRFSTLLFVKQLRCCILRGFDRFGHATQVLLASSNF